MISTNYARKWKMRFIKMKTTMIQQHGTLLSTVNLIVLYPT